MALEKPLSPVPSPHLCFVRQDPGGSLNQVNSESSRVAERSIGLGRLVNQKESSARERIALIDQRVHATGSARTKDKKALSTDVDKAVECFSLEPANSTGG